MQDFVVMILEGICIIRLANSGLEASRIGRLMEGKFRLTHPKICKVVQACHLVQ